MSILLLFTVFLYGCGGSAGVKNSTLQFEMLDVTTKAPIEDVQIIVESPDSGGGDGNATYVRRQLSTDSRGKVTFSDLAPDRQYTITASRDGYTLVTGGDNDGPQWIPDIHDGMIPEQGKTYTITGFMRRSQGATTGAVRGYIRDRLTGQPITNATVYITPSQGDGGASSMTISDTTDKPSKPGYYELNDVPSGLQSLMVVAPGYQAATISGSLVIPSGSTITYDVYLRTNDGAINFTVMAKDGEYRGASYTFVAQVLRNGTDVVAETLITLSGGTNNSTIKAFQVSFGGGATGGGGGGGGTGYTGPAVPVLPSSSNDTYTVKVTSDYAHMVNPANGISGILLKVTEGATQADNPAVNAGTITMAVERGQVEITLYQVPYTANITGTQNDTILREQATQAIITTVGALNDTVSRYTGESPDRYFHYTIENVPVGQRSFIVNFSGHTVTSGDGTISNVTVIKDVTTRIMENIDWSTSGN